MLNVLNSFQLSIEGDNKVRVLLVKEDKILGVNQFNPDLLIEEEKVATTVELEMYELQIDER